MTYEPITADKKETWVEWLNNQVEILSGKAEAKGSNTIFETPDGDVATGKDLVGNLLALLTNQSVTIN